VIARSDRLNKSIGNNEMNNYNNFTGVRDERNSDMEMQSDDEWILNVEPLSVQIDDIMRNYINELMHMPIGEIDVFEPQSGITADTTITPSRSDSKHQNLVFKDQMPGYTTDIETFTDPTRHLQDKNDVPLGDFFSRPQKILELEWGTGTTLTDQFNPWQLYFNNPRVRNRIANYKLMRCNLRLKVIINGNGFQYGRAIVAYWPLAGYDNFSTHTGLQKVDLIQTSQLPHLFLDPTTSTAGEMKIPFFWHFNYFDIPSSSWGAPGPSVPDAGRILIRTLNDLKHANGADDKVTVSFFCWAEDMELAMPTSRNPQGLMPQSGEEVDEANAKGTVSGPATAISKYASIAAGYAPIAPYAMATSKAANAVASVAKALGYSRPTQTVNPDPFRPTPTSQLATTTTPDTALKLTVDDKQELTIDPRISGVGSHDPLVIRDIAKRESYLTTFDWAVGLPPSDLLWNTRVSPVLWGERVEGSVVLPACAIAALPFRYWTGSMKFRFQIVCSTFHKGRLEFRFDPNTQDPNSRSDYNVNYIEIIDIAETQDFTMEVGMAQFVSLLTNLKPGRDAVSEGYSTTDYNFNNFALHNGVLQVRVLNELTVPNSTIDNDVQINVFISAGEDFEVFVPHDVFQEYTFFSPPFNPQSGTEMVPDSQNTEEPSAPQQANHEDIGGDRQFSSDLNKVYAGEAIVSFRPLLKRYNLWRRENNRILDQPPVRQRLLRRRFAYPFFRRGDAQDWVDGASYNYVNTVMLHWVTQCFAGWRGSIRYKYLFTESGIRGNESDERETGSRVYVERHDFDTSGPGSSYVNTATPVLSTFQSDIVGRRIVKGASQIPTGAKGTVFATDLINPNVEFEVPYQVNYRFVPGKKRNYTTIPDPALNMYNVVYEGATSPCQEVDVHVAAGEDFQVYFWTGMPRLFYEPIPPET
jgi:hypothetical protein